MQDLARRPEDVPAVFAERFNSGDQSAVAAAYEPDAIFVAEPGKTLTGAAAQAAHAGFMGTGRLTVRPCHVYPAGDLALLIVDWTITGTDQDSRPIRMEGTATDVARRGPDGHWRYVIDNPFGAAARNG